ncbi:futalosine hydrolase [Paenibacillus piri]|uniref:Futalosine hydrolase n=1 Tax=Paenibacillus piri TaxID=2547395 RepID=A0A4R5KK65_9BACL|nr:futalosine hydrolase [Paenibacillus piri]TDF95959.1 futalosine hydrolase [Paenibacillus piri]
MDEFIDISNGSSGSERSSGRARVLVMTAVEAEKEAVLRGLKGDSRFDVMTAGVGPILAAASTAAVLAAAQSAGYGLVVSAGIGGGFAGRAELGSLVVSDAMVAADLGAETPEGFLSLDELGFGFTRIDADSALAERVAGAFRAAGLQAVSGPVLTVSTVTGTTETARALEKRVPGAAAEGMEGFGIAVAARNCGLPALEIRAISNAVGPRDRDAWRIGDALKALEAASTVLVEVLA